MALVADLRLRFRPLARARVSALLADAAGAPVPLVVWLAASNEDHVLCRELSQAAGAPVIELRSPDPAGDCDHELAALGWADEHARELGAHPGQLIVVGRLAGAARAARLAVDVRDGGWPLLRRQLLVHAEFTEPGVMPFRVAGAAPATIITTGARGDDASRYAAILRRAGVEVREVGSDPRRALPIDEIGRVLG
jgi:alpha/beta hydrolase fold